MRTLIYVPAIHTSPDLGSLAKNVTRTGIAGFGEEFWREHEKTVDGFWDVITDYFNSLEVSGFKIFQDGMITDGEVGQKIIEEAVKSGSKNYMLISSLLKRGAVLVKTEDFNLVKQEHDILLAITQMKSISRKLIAFIKYKLIKNRLLNKRDKFIAGRINDTVKDGETGIIFMGASHNIREKLPSDFQIKEIKEIKKIKEYQKLLLFHTRNKQRFEELSKYLVSAV